MRRYLFIPALFLFLRTIPIYCIEESPSPVSVSVLPAETAYPCMAGQPVSIFMDDCSLVSDSGSLLHDMTIRYSSLPMHSVTMHSLMQNVSAGRDGIRFLPDGIHFSESQPALITLAYDPYRLPDGAAATDIYTYYREASSSQWYQLERVEIDTVRHTVTSYTTHFTDFANAVISTPDLPESNAYVPTFLTDLPDPDPLEGIPMVHLTGLGSFGSMTGDNSGSAGLTYPIVIPNGRHGLQPDVSLYYNSSNGNGPVGMGWSIPMPAVTIDTRWGAPRYDPYLETEAYLVNGEPVILHDHHDEILPLPHQAEAFPLREHQTVRFWFRDKRNAARVIRHGRYPTEYWWEVTTTNGITYYYGRIYEPWHPDLDGIDENSVLRDANGNIGYWALTGVEDPDGNYIRYQNRNSGVTAGIPDPNQEGDNIYPDYIDYTGNYNAPTPPVYRIDLTWKYRNDAFTDGRLGMLRLTEKLLCNVSIMYHDTIISSYYLNYECSANSLWKSRLVSIDKSDEPNCMIDCNYLELVLLDSKNFAGSRTTFTYNDAPHAVFSQTPKNVTTNKEFSKTISGSWNVGGTATVGVGGNAFQTGFSAGGNYNFSMQNGRTENMLLDLNGDGLPDLVYGVGNTVMYRPQLTDNLAFGAETVVSGLTRLSHDVSRTHNWGLQLSFGGHLHYSNPVTLSYTDYYFADINADGLPDMVTPDGILFNHLNSNGHPTFSLYNGSAVVEQHNSACPDAGIHYTGEVDERIECNVVEVAVDSTTIGIDNYHDNWEEPDDFYSKPYEETGTLLPQNWNPLPTRRQSGNESDPIVNNTLSEHAVWSGHTEKMGSGRPDTSQQPASDTPTTEQSSDNRGPFYENGYIYRLRQHKIIKYRLETVCHNDDPDPNIETVRVWVAEKSGYVQWINSIVSLNQDTSYSRQQSRHADGVRCVIQLNRNNQNDGTHFTSTQVTMLHADTIAADDYTQKADTISGFSVSAGDVILFRLCSGDNTMYDDVDWKITIRFNDSDGTHQGDTEDDFICTGQRPFVAPMAGDAVIRYKMENDYYPPVSLSFKGSNKPAVTYSWHGSTNGAYVAFDTVQLQTGDTIMPVVAPAGTIWSHVHIHPQVEYHWSHPNGDSTAIVQDTIFFYPDVDYPCPVITADSIYTSLFGKLYKGWGRFAYRPLDNSDTLDLCSLVNSRHRTLMQVPQDSSSWNAISVPQDSSSLVALGVAGVNEIFSTQHLYNPLADSSTWIPMLPDSRTERWIPYGNMGCVSRNGQSNSRNMQPTPEMNTAMQTVAAYVNDTLENNVYYDSAVPVAGSGNKILRKSTKSNQHCLSGGVLFLSESVSWGTYSVQTDFIDLNGDGFPDAVGPSAVQYTYPWGGLGDLTPLDGAGYESRNFGAGMNFSGTVALMKKLQGNSVTKPQSAIDGSGCGINHNNGDTETDRSFVDLNGDGLPDIVCKTDTTVRYNLGYHFTPPMKIVTSDFAIQKGYSLSNAGTGTVDWLQNVTSSKFAIEHYSISGGVDVSKSDNIDDFQLMDINGDGLPDMVRQTFSGEMMVAYNRGTRFSHPSTLQTVFDSVYLQSPLQKSWSWNLGVSVAGTMGLTFGIGKACFGLQGGGGYGETYADIAFIDINGDGTPDYVTQTSNGLSVRYNQTAGCNLLTRVTNATGQRISLHYKLSEPSSQHRQRHWILERFDDEDIESPWYDRRIVQTEKEYESPSYDNHERTDYGYERVSTDESGIRFTEERFRNDAYVLRGRKKTDLVFAKNGNDTIKYLGHYYDYAFRDQDNHYAAPTCNDLYLYSHEDAVYTEYYEGESMPEITTRIRMHYDNHHNLTEYIDEGDLAIPSDDWRRTVTYLPVTYKNLVSLPETDSVFTAGSNLLRLRCATWYPTGRMRQMLVRDPLTQKEALYSLFYDNYGNLAHYRLPANTNGERVNYMIDYDAALHALPVYVNNQFQEVQQYRYEPHWGKPVLSVDPNGAEVSYTYDFMGRLTHVLAPQEKQAYRHQSWTPEGSNVPYTIRYTYNNIRHNLADLTHDTIPHTYILKEQITPLEHAPVTEAAIYTARGERMQKKKITEVYGNVAVLTDGMRILDPLGRVKRSFYPSISNTALWLYYPSSNSTGANDTRMFYDILDRDTFMRLPDMTEIHKLYTFAKDCDNVMRLSAQVTDQRSNVTSTLTSPQGWTVMTLAADATPTCYWYNPIGELTMVRDADGYVTSYAYNGFGQQTARNHPDAGHTRWNYDAAGNLICSQTAKQAAINDSTSYDYCFNRLMRIRHEVHPWENACFNYDYAGRLAYREDRTGSERLWFDEFGNVQETLRRIIVPSEGAVFQFKTQYHYDSFGRIRQMTYPDGEIVNYSYQYYGGNLLGVQGAHIGAFNLHYDELGHLVHKDYVNGCYTNYLYDNQRQWLASMVSKSYYDGNTPFQDIEYLYYAEGNMERIKNYAMQWHNMGGQYYDLYFYDSRYRLAQNLHDDSYTGTTDYKLWYSPTTRMGHKYSDNLTIGRPDLVYGYDKFGYTHQPRVVHDIWSEKHLQLYWDKNGNLRQIQPFKNYPRFHMWDDDNQLLMSFGPTKCGYYGNASDGKRAYKVTGTCDISSINGGAVAGTAYFENVTLYPNPYMTLTEQGYTKHYFMGADRIGTTIGGGNGGNWLVNPIDQRTSEEDNLLYILKGLDYPYYYYGCYQYDHHDNHTANTDYTGQIDYYHPDYPNYQYIEDEVTLGQTSIVFGTSLADAISHYYQNNLGDKPYYYHSDHLGSAAWITDGQGLPVQYFMYAPYGEQRLSQHWGTYDERFRFTGKERDAETGYDYFGARYRGAKFLDYFLSVDPLADKYIYNSPYVYCSGNPIARLDPDGKADYYDIDGNHLCNDGVADNRVFQQSNKGDVVLGGFAMPFSYVGDVDNISLSYDGEMISDSQSEGILTVTQHVGDKEFNQTFSAVSGNRTAYTLQNGEYSCSSFRYRSSSEAKGGYYNNGYGFCINLNPSFTTKRTELRIHPDGGFPGTKGCIGLTGGASELKQFVRTVTPFVPADPKNTSILLTVVVTGNPGCYKAADKTGPALFR